MRLGKGFLIFGAMVLVAALCVSAYVYRFHVHDFFSQKKFYYLMLDKANGLYVSNPVFMRGLQIGNIQEIKLVQDEDSTYIRVRIDINDGISVGDASYATIEDLNILGSIGIIVHPGKNQETYTSGAFVPVYYKKEFTDMLGENSEVLILRFSRLLEKMNSMADEETQAYIKRVMRNIDTITGNLKGATTTLGTKNKGITTGMTKLTGRMTEIKKDLAYLSSVSAQFKGLDFAGITNEVAGVKQELAVLSETMKTGKGTVPLLMRDSTLKSNISTLMSTLKKTQE